MKMLVAFIAVVVLAAVIVMMSRKKRIGRAIVIKEYPTLIEEILAQPKELDIIIALHQKTDQKWAREGSESLTDAEKALLRVEELETEVNNGGFHQYFLNYSGDFAQDAAAALKAIGADHTAGIVTKACSVFPDGKPPRDEEKRQQLLDNIGEEGRQLLDDLSGEFFAYEDDLGGLLVEYVRRREDDFRGGAV